MPRRQTAPGSGRPFPRRLETTRPAAAGQHRVVGACVLRNRLYRRCPFVTSAGALSDADARNKLTASASTTARGVVDWRYSLYLFLRIKRLSGSVRLLCPSSPEVVPGGLGLLPLRLFFRVWRVASLASYSPRFLPPPSFLPPRQPAIPFPSLICYALLRPTVQPKGKPWNVRSASAKTRRTIVSAEIAGLACQSSARIAKGRTSPVIHSAVDAATTSPHLPRPPHPPHQHQEFSPSLVASAAKPPYFSPICPATRP